jgi:hypothetical protein
MQSEKVNCLAKFEPLMSLFMMRHSSCLERNKRTTGSSKTHTHHYLIKVRQEECATIYFNISRSNDEVARGMLMFPSLFLSS